MKLSIITINYNNKAGLQKTIDSVMSQTWRDFEWIIIDGGSKDGSKEVIENIASDPKSNISYWCSEPDKGIYNAMNKGIAHSKGDYLNFMNSGDCYYDADTLWGVSISIAKGDVDIVVGQAIHADDGSLLFEPFKEEHLHKQLLVFSVSHQAGFIKRKLIEKYLYDETLYITSDWKFYLQAYVQGHAKFKLIENVVAVMQPDGVSGANISARNDERRKVITEYYGQGVADLIRDYNALRWNEILKNTNVLLKNDPSLYRVVRRFLAFVMKFYFFKSKHKFGKKK